MRDLTQNRTPANPHAAMLAHTYVSQIRKDYEAAMAKRPAPKGQETAQENRTSPELLAFRAAIEAAWPAFEQFEAQERIRREHEQALMELPL